MNRLVLSDYCLILHTAANVLWCLGRQSTHTYISMAALNFAHNFTQVGTYGLIRDSPLVVPPRHACWTDLI